MSPFTALFIYLRKASCPFESIAAHIPHDDSVLDVGCGFGIFALMLAHRNPRQTIAGIDPDGTRVTRARELCKKYKRITFYEGTIHSVRITTKFDSITINDVLYLLPSEDKTKMVRRVRALLRPGGKLYIKFNPRSFSIRYFLTWAQEVLTVKLLKQTVSRHHGLYFESESEVVNLLVQNKFHIEKIVHLSTPFPFFHPHELIIGVK